MDESAGQPRPRRVDQPIPGRRATSVANPNRTRVDVHSVPTPDQTPVGADRAA